jgi:hypothetical protein
MNTGFNNNMAFFAHFIVNYERILKERYHWTDKGDRRGTEEAP